MDRYNNQMSKRLRLECSNCQEIYTAYTYSKCPRCLYTLGNNSWPSVSRSWSDNSSISNSLSDSSIPANYQFNNMEPPNSVSKSSVNSLTDSDPSVFNPQAAASSDNYMESPNSVSESSVNSLTDSDPSVFNPQAAASSDNYVENAPVVGDSMDMDSSDSDTSAIPTAVSGTSFKPKTVTLKYNIVHIDNMIYERSLVTSFAGLLWQIRVWRGESGGKRYLSVYLRCFGCQEGCHYNVFATYELLARQPINNVARNCLHVFTSDNEEQGCAEFIDWEVLMDDKFGYVNNNSITITVDIEVKFPVAEDVDQGPFVIKESKSGNLLINEKVRLKSINQEPNSDNSVKEEPVSGVKEVKSFKDVRISNINRPKRGNVPIKEEPVSGVKKTVTLNYKIPNIKGIKGIMSSTTTRTENLSWQILASSVKIDTKRHLAVFLRCNGCRGGLTCSVAATYKLIAKDPNKSLVRNTRHVFSGKNNEQGYNEFIDWETLMDAKNGYVDNDSITIEVVLEEDLPTYTAYKPR